MEIIFLCVIIFLFLLAIFDLTVGVSNDAVNFLSSAIGARAASFKRILIVASIGVFIGAAMSNGMMDIARHGIFRPEHFSFYDIICIFMAVMVTDIILLDIFNSLGMPTSTTVSMVFELLGATFVVALIKMSHGASVGLDGLINTEKALSVIIGIFLSVAIAFFFGIVVQLITRLIFRFDYRSSLKWKVGIFGGLCATAMVYFLLLKGFKDLSFMTPDAKAWIDANTGLILCGSLAFFTVLMQILHAVGVNVLKVIVLMGTFALAMAFAGNDLVNFIGVPLSGLASYTDYAANGAGDPTTFTMDSLNQPADTSIWFLIAAGAMMVVALATSRKARNVTKTQIGLGAQGGAAAGGDEMFGSSRIARRLVRWTLSVLSWVDRVVPTRIRRRFNSRMNTENAVIEPGAAFDLVRGSVNLVLAGALIALGTSLKLPLSTTFVTFMVAMGSSLSDRAWDRESAVFRITGVISVIGGWFITAAAAFIGAGVIVLLMYYGGQWVMFGLGLLTIVLLIRSNRRFKKRKDEDKGDAVFNSIISSPDHSASWDLVLMYITEHQHRFLEFAAQTYSSVTTAFADDSVKPLARAHNELTHKKDELKNARRKETLCLRYIPRRVAIEKSTWFYLGNNSCMSILYNLRRINEISKEHVENNFHRLPQAYHNLFADIRLTIDTLFSDTLTMMQTGTIEAIPALRRTCDRVKDKLSDAYHSLYDSLREDDPSSMTVLYVYMNILQESHEMVSALRKYMRAFAKLHDTEFSSRANRQPNSQNSQDS